MTDRSTLASRLRLPPCGAVLGFRRGATVLLASLLLAGSANQPAVAQPAGGEEVQRFANLGWGVRSLAFSPNAEQIAVGKMDRTLLVFDVKSGQRLVELKDLSRLGEVSALAYTPSGQQLVAGGVTGRIVVLDVDPEHQLRERGGFFGHTGGVTCLDVHRNGQTAVSGAADKRLCYWDLATGRERFRWEGLRSAAKSVRLSVDGRTVLVTDGQVCCQLDLQSGEEISRFELTRGPQTAEISPDGQVVVSNQIYQLKLWSTLSGSPLPPLDDRELSWSARFTPDGRRLLTGVRGQINVWDVETQRRVHAFETAGSGYIQSLAVSADGRLVAGVPGSAGQTLQVFRLPGGDSR